MPQIYNKMNRKIKLGITSNTLKKYERPIYPKIIFKNRNKNKNRQKILQISIKTLPQISTIANRNQIIPSVTLFYVDNNNNMNNMPIGNKNKNRS